MMKIKNKKRGYVICAGILGMILSFQSHAEIVTGKVQVVDTKNMIVTINNKNYPIEIYESIAGSKTGNVINLADVKVGDQISFVTRNVQTRSFIGPGTSIGTNSPVLLAEPDLQPHVEDNMPNGHERKDLPK